MISKWANKICKKFPSGLVSWKCLSVRKLNKSSHRKIFLIMHRYFASRKKHLGMFLNESLNFSYHIKEKMSKAVKGTGVINKLSKTLPWHSLITIHNISHLWDLSFIMVILFMTNQIMIVSIKKLKEFSAVLLLQLQLPSKEHLRVNYITIKFWIS